MKRKIIKIDEELCNGCGECVPNCAEGALQIIDSKARLISDLFCDGLGACLGHCPTGAITIEEREAEAYSERKTMEDNIIPAGLNTIKAHLKHLREHGETEFLKEALEVLKEYNILNPLTEKELANHAHQHSSCPGSKMMVFDKEPVSKNITDNGGTRPSELSQWPVQLHLLSPVAPYFKGADVLLASDCSAFTAGDFHKDYLKGKILAIACPKLDTNLQVYVDKIKIMIEESKINTITVLIMEVPCCRGLTSIVKKAVEDSNRKIPIKELVLSVRGEKIREEWI